MKAKLLFLFATVAWLLAIPLARAATCITVSPATVTLQAGGTQQFTATLSGCTGGVTWSTIGGGSITSGGDFTASGTYTQQTSITVKAARTCCPTNFGTATVTVIVPKSLAISPTAPSILVGNYQTMTATLTFSDNSTLNVSTVASYSSSNTSVATANGNTITGEGAGSANITATYAGLTSPASAFSVTAPPAAVSANFFGLDINSLNSPWPTQYINFHVYRSLGSSIKWADINTASGTNGYTWTNFDKWMAKLQPGQAVMFTAYATPSWASSRGVNSGNPDYNCAFQSQNGPGICDPPSDLSSGDNYWKNFITALLNHCTATNVPLKYLEVWNEPNIDTEWNGKAAQLVQMQEDAFNLVQSYNTANGTSIQVISPPVTPSTSFTVPNFFIEMVNNNPSMLNYADIVGFHGYIGHTVSNIDTMLDSVQQNSAGKLMYDTEGSWGQQSPLTDVDQQRAFVGGYYLTQATFSGLQGFNWYGWDFTSVNFYQTSPAGLTPAGTAYAEVYKWLTGASPTAACSANGTTWTCNFTRAGNYYAQAVWDTSQTCNNGVCTSIPYTYPTEMVQYRELMDNNVNSLGGGTVLIGLKPILLETNTVF
jgi:hypothetical protein